MVDIFTKVEKEDKVFIFQVITVIFYTPNSDKSFMNGFNHLHYQRKGFEHPDYKTVAAGVPAKQTAAIENFITLVTKVMPSLIFYFISLLEFRVADKL